MLLILAFLYLFHNTISAAPVLRESIPPDLKSSANPCTCPDQQRSLWDILWSCLATIFACTWVSVHPNIPPSGEKWWKTGLRRLELMFWGLIAPEFVIYWAMSQWYGARTILEKYYGHGWTKTHAYFIQMGGFTLFEAGKPKGVLLPEEMERLLLAGKINLPEITEEEIRDRSKGDGLSKALVVGQTSWFIAQCIARRAQGLVLTELEVVTAAFAVLNGIMYFLWWNKPLDIRCSVAIHLLDKPTEPFEFKSMEISRSSIRDTILSLSYPLKEILSSLATGIWKSMKTMNLKAARRVMKIIAISPWTAIRVFFSRVSDIYYAGIGGAVLEVAGSISTVSTFYASTDYTSAMTDNLLVPSVTSIIAALFGGLHCAAWFFTFPSYTERMIWRVCSVVISIVPLGLQGFIIVRFCEDNAKSYSISKKLFRILMYPFTLSVFCLPMYAIARLLLLGEAFAALRYLPPDALAVVDWLSFLPHI